MKYSNLTTNKKILSWFNKNPEKINQLCEHTGHILDWIFNGYRGKNEFKVSLTHELVKQGANLSLVKEATFISILDEFICGFRKKDDPDYNEVLIQIGKQSIHLDKIKNNFSLFNSIIEKYPFTNHQMMSYHESIIFSNCPKITDSTCEVLHPVVYLLSNYVRSFESYNQIVPYKNIRQIEKFHKMNDSFVFSKFPLKFNLENRFHIIPSDSIIIILEKIITNLSPMESQILSQISDPIKQIQKRDLVRSLNDILKLNNTTIKQKAKI